MNSTEELIEDIRNGKIVLLVDDEDRENEGDLVLAADFVSPEAINFMAKEARGLICLSLSPQQVDRLELPMMVRDDMNFSPNQTAFTVSVEASSGVSTGISAADRSHTIRVAANPQAKPSDVRMPGHIFPIRAQSGGVLKRAGHTEGSIDLATLAGLQPAAVICEVMNDDGTMARVPELKAFAKKHGIKIGTIVDLIKYRLQHESLVEEVYSQKIEFKGFENLVLKVFRSKIDQTEHLVFQNGVIDRNHECLVRMQQDHFLRDIFNTMKFNRSIFFEVLGKIAKNEPSVMVLLRGSNRPRIASEVEYLLNPASTQPVPMDDRDYGIGAQILRALGLQKIKLLTSQTDRKVGLKAFGLEVVEMIPLAKI